MSQGLLFTEITTDNATKADSASPNMNLSFHEKVEIAEKSFVDMYSNYCGIVFAYSSGKDSSIMLAIGLKVAVELKKKSINVPKIVIIHGNTLLENPVIDEFSKKEIVKIENFIMHHDLDAEVIVATPGMSQNQLINLVGGRTILSMPDTDSKCSVDLKITPITRAKKKAFKSFGKKAKVVSCIGTRFEESDVRLRNMTKRGESELSPVEINGELVLSPIAHFTLDDVWLYIGEVTNGMRSSYSNFQDLMDVYRDGESGACAVIAYMDGKARSTGCGARFGCFHCVRNADDRSMNNMLKDDKYAYMRPLNQFRQWLKDTHYNPSNRNWLPRTVSTTGTVQLSPNAYSPQHCEDMLKIALTIQVRENERAYAIRQAPKFNILREEDILAVDVLWNRYSYTSALRASEIYKMIVEEGFRYDIPTVSVEEIHRELPKFKPVTVPFADKEYDGFWNGLRDLDLMIIDQEPTTVKSNGVIYNDISTESVMSIDPESADMFFGFPELGVDHALSSMARNNYTPCAGFWYLSRLGVFSIAKGQHSEFDRMLKMGNQISRHGIRDILNNPVKLQAKLLSIFGEEEKDTSSVFMYQQKDIFAA